MIDLVIIRKTWSFGVIDKALYNNSRIIGIWSTLKPKKLNLRAFNKMIYWEKNYETSKAQKVRPEKLSSEGFVN